MYPYNTKIYRRKSIRLKGYDYAQPGLYFVTICCQNMAHLFGYIQIDPTITPPKPRMFLNSAGQMVERWYFELEHKFPNIKCREMVVMPNHFHCILEIVATTAGTDLRVCPTNGSTDGNKDLRACPTDSGAGDNKDLRVDPTNVEVALGIETILDEHDILSEHALSEHLGSPLHQVLQWFKTMTTNEYIRGVKSLGWPPFDRKVWQRSYYEIIIRDRFANKNIVNYIIKNPEKWWKDKFNGGT